MKNILLAAQTGAIFLTTMVSLLIMLIIGGYIFQVTTQDTHLIAKMKRSLQAQQIAEGGLARALSTLYTNWSASVATSDVALGVGTYSASLASSNGRYLVSSVGSAEGVTRSVSAEVTAPANSAFNYALAGGGNVTWDPGTGGSSGTLTGDLYAGGNLSMGGTINGNAYAGGSISGSNNGTQTTPAGAVSFPTVTNGYYKTIAQTNGQYISGNKTYNSGSPLPVSPAGGVIYVTGDVTINDVQSTTAVIFAEGNITMTKSGNSTPRLTVNQYSNYPAIVTLGNLTIDAHGNSSNGSALITTGLVYTGGNFDIIGNHYNNPRISITGSLISRGNITTSLTAQNNVVVTFVKQNPPGFSTSLANTSIVSYNS